MKNVMITSLAVIFLLSACSSEEKKLELFSPDAFAFQLSDGWELNASTRVKGFFIEEGDEDYTARLSYYLNLVLPSGKVLKDVTSDLVTEKLMEEPTELSIETQVILDSTFAGGEYKVIFYVTDDYSGKEAIIEKTFDL